MKLIVDDRERQPDLMKVLKSYPKPIEFRRLQYGDYACESLCCSWERKQDDFTEAQFHRILQQVHELNMAYKNSYLVVNDVASLWLKRQGMKYYNQRKGFIASLTSRGMPPMWINDHFLMIDWIFETIKKNHDRKMRGSGEFSHMRSNLISHKDRAMHILGSLPNVGPTHAKEILREFGSVMNFLRADEKQIKQVKGIGPKTCDAIIDALCKEVDVID